MARSPYVWISDDNKTDSVFYQFHFSVFFLNKTTGSSYDPIYYDFSSKQTACNPYYVCISDGKKSELVCHRDKTINDVVNKINQHL